MNAKTVKLRKIYNIGSRRSSDSVNEPRDFLSRRHSFSRDKQDNSKRSCAVPLPDVTHNEQEQKFKTRHLQLNLKKASSSTDKMNSLETPVFAQLRDSAMSQFPGPHMAKHDVSSKLSHS